MTTEQINELTTQELRDLIEKIPQWLKDPEAILAHDAMKEALPKLKARLEQKTNSFPNTLKLFEV